MSYSAAEGFPYQPGTPEYDEFMRGAWRGAALPATNVPVGALGALLPSPDAHGVENVVPGAASGLYSTADMVQQFARKHLLGEANPSHLPGGERAGELAAGSEQRAASIVPHMEPQTAGEEVITDAARAGGAMALPLPGSVARALPGPARVLGHVMLPGPGAALPAAVIAGGISGVTRDAMADKGGLDFTIPNDMPTIDTPNVVDLTGQMSSAATKAPRTDPRTVTADSSTDGTDQPLPPAPQVAQLSGGHYVHDAAGFDVFEPGPVSSDDVTPFTWKDAALFGLGTVAVLGGARYARPLIKSLTEIKTGERPPGVDALSIARGSVSNQDAVAQDVLKSMDANPTTGTRLAKEYGDVNGSMPIHMRYQASAESGDFHGVQMPSIRKWQANIAQLSDDQRDMLNKAMHYGNELDNRKANQRTWVGNVAPTDADLAVNFRDIQGGPPLVSTADLQAEVARARADPQVADLIDRAKMQTDAFADVMASRGMLTQQEAARLKGAHTHYVPDADLEGIIMSPLKSRELDAGAGISNHDMTPVWQLRDQHDFALFKAIEQNQARRMVMDTIDNYQGRNPNAQQIMRPSRDRLGDYVAADDGSSIAVRRNGVLEHYVINDAGLRNALKGPPVQMNAVLGGMNRFRQFTQSFITGPGALAFGHVFSVINAVRSAGEIGVLRPKGMYGTPLEKLTRGVIQADPVSPYVGLAYRMGADATSESARGLSAFLSPDNPGGIAQFLTGWMGDPARRAISARLQAVYDNSVRGAMRERGLLNSAGFTAKVVDDTTVKGRPAFMPSMDAVPELFRLNSMTGTATYVHLKNFFNEMRSVMGDAAHSQFFALNKDNPKLSRHELNYEVRQITGDPGTRGGGSVARAYSATVPFGNVSMQEVARVARAFNEAPVGTTLRFLSHYGVLAMASVFTAMMAGPAAVKHLFDETTDLDRAKDIKLYVPGGDPENPIRMPVQIMMRAPVNVMLQAAYDMMQVAQHEHNPDMAEWAQSVMSDFFHHHVWQSTANGTVAGASSGLPPLMPVFGDIGAAALTGKSVDPTLYNAYMHGNQPISGMFSYDLNGNRHVPGQDAKIDPVTGSVNGDLYQHVVSNVMGVGGVALWDFMRDATHKRGGVDAAMSNFIDGYARRATADVPGGNLLWSVGDKLARSTALQERVERSLEVMRPTATWKADMKYQGLTRKGGQQIVEPSGEAKTPSDPTMKRLYAMAGTYMNVLNTKQGSPMKQLNDYRTQVAALRNSPLPPEEVRKMTNDYEKRIQVQLGMVQSLIDRMNSQMSAVVGHQVDIRRVDWSKGPEQFDR